MNSSISQSFAKSWQLYRATPGQAAWVTLLFVLLYITIAIVLSIAARTLGTPATFAQSLGMGLMWLYLSAGYVLYGTRGLSNEPRSIRTLFAGGRFVIRILVASVAQGLVQFFILLPAFALIYAVPQSRIPPYLLILSLIPLLWVVIRLSFAVLYVVDSDCGSFVALQLSWQRTGKYFWKTTWMLTLICCVAVAGLLAAGIGALISFPTALYAYIQYGRSILSN